MEFNPDFTYIQEIKRWFLAVQLPPSQEPCRRATCNADGEFGLVKYSNSDCRFLGYDTVYLFIHVFVLYVT
jgi:hypothetical protein